MRSVVVLLLCLLFAFAGCIGPEDDGDSLGEGPETGPDDTNGGDDTEGNTTDDPDEDTEEGLGPEPEPKRDPVTWEISIQGNDFVDGSITIQMGDSVRWTHNDGDTAHTVTSEDDQTEEFDSHPDCVTLASVGCMTGSSEPFEWTFDAVGTTDYVCKVHASMTDTITVLERHDAAPS